MGSHLLTLLLESPHYALIRSLVRRPSGRVHPKLKEHVVDFDRLGDSGDAVQGNDVFCCLGTTIKVAGSPEAFRKVDLSYVVDAADTAHRNGASRFFVVSSIGASTRSSSFYLRVKGEMEETLARIPYAAVGIVRPSLLLGERKEHRLGERIGAVGMRVASVAMVGRLRRLRPIQAADVAAGMLFLSRTNFTGVRVVESDEIQRMSDLEEELAANLPALPAEVRSGRAKSRPGTQAGNTKNAKT
ncbi:MAG: NAD(P)H-binding protein [Bacteroidetes bacterium]|nr:NAD(P)H-binding protein [Bacteroidota bacterium]